jgi:hypothetical protein
MCLAGFLFKPFWKQLALDELHDEKIFADPQEPWPHIRQVCPSEHHGFAPHAPSVSVRSPDFQGDPLTVFVSSHHYADTTLAEHIRFENSLLSSELQRDYSQSSQFTQTLPQLRLGCLGIAYYRRIRFLD